MSGAFVYRTVRGDLADLRLAAAAEPLPATLKWASSEWLSHTAVLEGLLHLEMKAAVPRR
jgi:hypothetical protein